MINVEEDRSDEETQEHCDHRVNEAMLLRYSAVRVELRPLQVEFARPPAQPYFGLLLPFVGELALNDCEYLRIGVRELRGEHFPLRREGVVSALQLHRFQRLQRLRLVYVELLQSQNEFVVDGGSPRALFLGSDDVVLIVEDVAL